MASATAVHAIGAARQYRVGNQGNRLITAHSLRRRLLGRSIGSHSRALCSDRERQRVQVGDYHYYGWGTHVHHKKAVAHYRTAAESRDAQAYFNLA